MDLSVRWSVFDIDDIPTYQIQNVVTFGAKMMVKWSTTPVIDEGPAISGLCQ